MDIPTPERLIELIDAFLIRHDLAETRFGRDAVNDPAFVSGLRKGRKLPGILRLNQIARYMAERDAGAGHVVDDMAADDTTSPGTSSAISVSDDNLPSFHNRVFPGERGHDNAVVGVVRLDVAP